MSRFWPWLGRHALAVKFTSATLAILILVSGIAAGIRHASSLSPARVSGGNQAVPVAAHVPATRHTVVGVVRAVGPNEFLVRNPRGVYFAVRWQADAHFRANGHEIPPGTLRVGDRVVVLGRPTNDGALRAGVVSIVARGSASTPAVQRPATSGGLVNTAPAVAPARSPLPATRSAGSAQ